MTIKLDWTDADEAALQRINALVSKANQTLDEILLKIEREKDAGGDI